MTINEIKDKAIPILKDYGVTRAALFGSQARDERKDGSDIDLLVDVNDDLSLLDLIGLKIDLEEAFGVNVDLVEYGAVKPSIKERIMADQVVIL